jgi:hypothetical protein
MHVIPVFNDNAIVGWAIGLEGAVVAGVWATRAEAEAFLAQRPAKVLTSAQRTTARTTARTSTLARAFGAGTVEWIDDMPTAIA